MDITVFMTICFCGLSANYLKPRIQLSPIYRFVRYGKLAAIAIGMGIFVSIINLDLPIHLTLIGASIPCLADLIGDWIAHVIAQKRLKRTEAYQTAVSILNAQKERS